MNLGTFDSSNGYLFAPDTKIEFPVEPIAVWLLRPELGHDRRELAGSATNFSITGNNLHGDVILTYPGPIIAGGFDIDRVYLDTADTSKIRSARLRSITVRPAPTPGVTP